MIEPPWREPLVGDWIWFDQITLPSGDRAEWHVIADFTKAYDVAPKQKPGRSKQDYQTPPAFLAAVKRRLGIDQFTIDLAASAANTVVPGRFYDEAQDSLQQSWHVGAGYAWLNPPFARVEPWVAKASRAANTGAQVAVLVPASVGADWWRDYVDGKACVLLLNGRITFVGETKPYPKDCCLLLYGPAVAPGYSVWQWRRWIPKTKEHAA